jgi:hypothetical protein
MRKEIAETYSHKFDSPFTAWLYQVSLDGCDDEFGDVDSPLGCWVGRLGKHILIAAESGYCYSIRALKSATADAMWTWADEYFGADRMAEYFKGDDPDPDGWVCVDCTMMIANGDPSGIPDEYLADVMAGLDKLSADAFITDHRIEFGTMACDCCGSRLAGGRVGLGFVGGAS